MARGDRKIVISVALPQVPISLAARHAAVRRTLLWLIRFSDDAIKIVLDQFSVPHSVCEVKHRDIDLDIMTDSCCRSVEAQDCRATLIASLVSCGMRIECKENWIAFAR